MRWLHLPIAAATVGFALMAAGCGEDNNAEVIKATPGVGAAGGGAPPATYDEYAKQFQQKSPTEMYKGQGYPGTGGAPAKK